MQYFEARYYDNGIGRFNSIDRVFWEVWNTNRWIEVLQFPQKINAYTYSINNPTTYNDLSWEYADVVIESWVAMWKFWYWVWTWNAQLQLEGQKQLYSTINPKNALNPVKKIKNVKKVVNAVKKWTNKVDNTSPKAKEKLKEKLMFEEAKWKWVMRIPKEQMKDPSLKWKYQKDTYTHKDLDWKLQHDVHYVKNPNTWHVKDFKIKDTTKQKNNNK